MHIQRSAHVASAEARSLVVADWTVDPYAVVAACRRRAAGAAASFTLVVPAWLHGLDWAGDPAASEPCAQRQLEKLADLAARAGLHVDAAAVGDPHVMSAIGDALYAHDAGEILLFERARWFGLSHPLDLLHRARRATGLPVRRHQVRPAARPRGWTVFHGGHCEADGLPAA